MRENDSSSADDVIANGLVEFDKELVAFTDGNQDGSRNLDLGVVTIGSVCMYKIKFKIYDLSTARELTVVHLVRVDRDAEIPEGTAILYMRREVSICRNIHAVRYPPAS